MSVWSLPAYWGYVAGFSELLDLVGRTWVSVFALAAGVSTTLAILAFTTLKPREHMQAAASYEKLYLELVDCNIQTPEGREQFAEVMKSFREVVDDTNRSGSPLTPGQVRRSEREARRVERNARKFEKEAREELPSERVRAVAVLLPEPLDPAQLEHYEA